MASASRHCTPGDQIELRKTPANVVVQGRPLRFIDAELYEAERRTHAPKSFQPC
jgi:hypothetical protein